MATSARAAHRFAVTVRTNRDVTDDEVARMPVGWSRNRFQAYYVQVHDVAANSIGDAARQVERALEETGPALHSLTMQVRLIEPGPLGITPEPG